MTDFLWGKVLVAVVTPFDERGKVNYALAGKLCEHLLQGGCDGVVLSGTTGEAATLSVEEKLTLFAEVSSRVGNSGQVVAGVGCNDTRKTMNLINEAEKIKLDAYMAVTPFYNKPNSAGLIQHYRALDAVSSRPLMLYNVPSRTGMDISVPVLEQIFAFCPRVTALKEASGDLDKASMLVASYRDRITLLSGNDNLLLPLMALGFHGVVSVAANIVPSLVAGIVQNAVSAPEIARQLHLRAQTLFRALFVETNPVPVKAALVNTGWPVGLTRLPLAPLGTESTKILENALMSIQEELG